MFPRNLSRWSAAALAGALVTSLAGCASTSRAHEPPPEIPPAGDIAELSKTDLDAWLDGRLPNALQNAQIPGAVVTVVANGDILTTRGYGYATVGATPADSTPVDGDDTLFRIGSVTKIATATAVMQQVEVGRLDLDADVSEYVDVDIPRGFDDDISLRHLLTHTGGFEERVGGLMLPESSDFDLADYVTGEPPSQVYRPGTTPAYSNYGIALAGYVVQEVSGERFEDYVDEHVLHPAGMTSSTMQQPLPDELADRAATGYPILGATSPGFEVIGGPPAGAMSATGSDMGRFMLAQLGQSVGEPVLGESTRQLMQQSALDTASLGALAEGQRMTLGYFDESRNGHRILGHSGDTKLFHSAMEIYPEDGVGIFVAMNGTGDGGASAVLRSNVLLGFSDRYFADGEAEQQAAADGADALERSVLIAGQYESTRSMRSTFLTITSLLEPITVEALPDGRLMLDAGGGPRVFEEVSPWHYREVSGHRELGVQMDGDEVLRIGYNSAMSLVPVTPVRAGLMPTLAASAVVLGLLVIGSVVASVRRRFFARSLESELHRRRLTVAAVLARVGTAVTLGSLVGWVMLLLDLQNFNLVTEMSIRTVQALTAVSALAFVAAAIDLAQVFIRRARWTRVLPAILLPLALAAFIWAVWQGQLLGMDITY